MSFREEFRLRKMWCNEVMAERFFVFQWRSPGLVFLTYRMVMAAYTVIWLAITASHAHTSTDVTQVWGAYLTNWTYTLLTAYFVCHAIMALVVYTMCRRAGLKLTQSLRPVQHSYLFHEIASIRDGYEPLGSGSTATVAFEQGGHVPWYLAILWILFSAASVASIMVTLVFWAVLVPWTNMEVNNNDNIQLHLVNSILVLIEHAVTALPVRLLHVIYPVFYGVIYMLFSLFYWVEDHSHVMYPILDWGKPGETVGWVLLVGFVVIPLIHLLIYGFYRLRIRIYSAYCAHV